MPRSTPHQARQDGPRPCAFRPGAALAIVLAVGRLAHAGADWVEPYPMTIGVPNVIHGSGLAAVCAVTIEGSSAPILSQSDTEIAIQIPPSIPVPPPTWPPQTVAVCFELAPCPGVLDCKTAFLGYEVFTYDPPPVVGSAPTPGCAKDVHLRGGVAFVQQGIEFGPGARGIVSFDVSNPALPLAMGSLPLLDPKQFVVSGNLLYVSDLTGLVIVDATDPAALKVAGTVDLGAGGSRSVALAGSHAYAEASKSFAVLDLTDPRKPVVIARLEPADLGGLEVRTVKPAGSGLMLVTTLDPLAMGLNDSGPILAIDVTRPAQPRLVTEQPGMFSAGIEAGCSFVYGVVGSDAVDTACADLGCIDTVADLFLVGDLGDPRHIVNVAYLFTLHAPQSAALEPIGDLLFATSGPFGQPKLLAADVSEPRSPKLLTAKTLPGDNTFGLEVKDGFAYVARCFDGFAILDVCALTGCPLPPQPPLPACSAKSAKSPASR